MQSFITHNIQQKQEKEMQLYFKRNISIPRNRFCKQNLTPFCIYKRDMCRGPLHDTGMPISQDYKNSRLQTCNKWFYTLCTVVHHRAIFPNSLSLNQ